MTPWTDPRLLLVLATSAVATLLLAALARRLGRGDAPVGPAAARKLQRTPVPTVGGLALLLALAVAPQAPSPSFAGGEGVIALTLLLAFLVGAWDDRRPGGLSPFGKLALQAATFLPLCWTELRAAGEPALEAFLLGALVLVVGVLALNVANTFDNADGALASVAAVGFALPVPAVCAALLGFLPFNLDARRPWNRARGAPTAYLGDAGAHVVAILVLLVPAAWPSLWIPLLDLMRLSVVRWRAGSRPWIGDRRHLAHRLQARGLGSPAVAATLVLLSLPGVVGGGLAAGSLGPLLVGLALGALAYGAALRWAPEIDSGA